MFHDLDPTHPIERLERENAMLRATIDVLRRQLAKSRGERPGLLSRAVTFLVGLPSLLRRRRVAARLAEQDARAEAARLMMAGGDDV